ncbi:hypothetical protein [Bifidobacterium miconisargentati]|uniref:hypothetical protein n=1 Tax=Bifidobacterium miconisargentati TaxID=2834437 RepID=UPI001BDCE620|nr:hypothetical protein [Bifidobacterium miconisargentati]MBW3090071.1 hypothetical protein [Bifidobacterium miconisargentati]
MLDLDGINKGLDDLKRRASESKTLKNIANSDAVRNAAAGASDAAAGAADAVAKAAQRLEEFAKSNERKSSGVRSSERMSDVKPFAASDDGKTGASLPEDGPEIIPVTEIVDAGGPSKPSDGGARHGGRHGGQTSKAKTTKSDRVFLIAMIAVIAACFLYLGISALLDSHDDTGSETQQTVQTTPKASETPEADSSKDAEAKPETVDTGALVGRDARDVITDLQNKGLTVDTRYVANRDADHTSDVLADTSTKYVVKEASQTDYMVTLIVEADLAASKSDDSSDSGSSGSESSSDTGTGSSAGASMTAAVRVACNQAGERAFPYGFKAHGITGVVQEVTLEADGTYAYVVMADVKNAAGQKQELQVTCTAVSLPDGLSAQIVAAN